LKNKFQALTYNPDEITTEKTDVNSKWDQIRTIFQKTSEYCLGFNLGKKMKKLITPGTWKVKEERRNMNKKILDTKSERLQERHKASYRELDKTVKQWLEQIKELTLKIWQDKQKKQPKKVNKEKYIK